ncbi:MAG TPA: hypothetical protein VLR69_04810 [Thermoanaerobaculia bacterium]|nr:hypothetical protein [Thermoanaerobaculia bacterium]
MPSRWTGPALRAALALTAITLALTAAGGYRALRTSRDAESARLERDGVSLDTAALGREPDPDGVRLRAARTVLAAELDPTRRQGLPPEQAARESAARMAEAAATARGVLALRPASWEAALVAGAATYLEWSQARDPRLFTAYRQWEAPLETALRLAPAKREPVRFLAAAYLEIWPALSPRKREIAHGLLTEVFRDPEELSALLSPWLDTAADRREAFSVLPDDPEAWEKVERAYAERRDLAGLTEARQRRERSLLSRLRRDLLRADRLSEQGDEEEARDLYLSVAGRARPEARYLDLLQSALQRCPPGPVDAATAKRLAPHLARALDRCLFASCDLPPATLKRLAHFVRDQEPSQAALAALFAGDLPRAALYERRTEGLGTEPWAPYLIAKARVLAARGQADDAREALALVHLSWQGKPLYWQAQAEVARAAGDASAGARAAARLAGLTRRAWSPQDWTWHRGTARLEMMTAAPAAGLAVALDQVPANGALVELRLDGAAVGQFPVRPPAAAAAPLRVAAPLGSGLHVLELESLDGSQVLPGVAELR